MNLALWWVWGTDSWYIDPWTPRLVCFSVWWLSAFPFWNHQDFIWRLRSCWRYLCLPSHSLWFWGYRICSMSCSHKSSTWRSNPSSFWVHTFDISASVLETAYLRNSWPAAAHSCCRQTTSLCLRTKHLREGLQGSCRLQNCQGSWWESVHWSVRFRGWWVVFCQAGQFLRWLCLVIFTLSLFVKDGDMIGSDSYVFLEEFFVTGEVDVNPGLLADCLVF